MLTEVPDYLFCLTDQKTWATADTNIGDTDLNSEEGTEGTKLLKQKRTPQNHH